MMAQKITPIPYPKLVKIFELDGFTVVSQSVGVSRHTPALPDPMQGYSERKWGSL